MNILHLLAKDLWIIDHPFRVMGLELGTRTTIVRLTTGGLWLHSPGPLSQALSETISTLGPVEALVAPNAMHHLYLQDNIRAFPDAKVYLSPALPPKLKFQSAYEVLLEEIPASWSQDLVQHHVGGLPQLQEFVFFHPVSRTLILTDLAFNIRNSASWFTRSFMRLNGGYNRFGSTRLFRSLIKDRAALRSSLDIILKWGFERIIVAHGQVVEDSGQHLMREAYRWLEEPE